MADYTPLIVAGVPAGLALLGSVYAVRTQYKAAFERREIAQAAATASTQAGNIKTLLDSWGHMVGVMSAEVKELRASVLAIEGRERECQEERIVLMKRIAVLEDGK